MISVKRLAAMLRRAWQDRASSRHQLKRLPSTRRLYLEALEDRLCPSGGYLLTSSYNTDSVQRYDENTGAYVDTIVPPRSGGLREPMGVLFGPDHNLYVSSGIFATPSNNGNSHKAVLQYSGTTGAFLSDFADQNQFNSPRGIIFGPDGNLYVADGDPKNGPGTVARFNGTTGAFMDDFVPAGSGGLEHPGALLFGPDGALYVASFDLNEILRYDGKTGAFLGTFVTPGSGGLNIPQMMAFGPDGNLYVASGNFFTGSPFAPGSVLRYEGLSGPNPGAFLGTFVPAGSGGLANPTGLLFGPDGKNDGKLDLYVASSVVSGTSASESITAEPGTSEVLRYDGKTGAFLGTFVTPDSGGLQLPTFMTFTETDPTTLNYDGAATNSKLTAATTATPTQPAAATVTTNTASPLIASGSTSPAPLLASPPPGNSSIDPAALSVALSLSQLPAMPAAISNPVLLFAQAPLLTPSLTSNLPPDGHDTDSSEAVGTSMSAADRVFASLDGELSLTMLVDDLTLAGGSSEDLTAANLRG
jgi:DNA-binding beta-propeller fold protein YncE